MLDAVGVVVSYTVLLIPVVILHEVGHLLAAKVTGTWVREFGLGLRPRILKLFKWGETVFSLNALLPLGGFCDMTAEEGEEPPNGLTSMDEQPPLTRIIVVAAGPLLNLALAFLLAIGLFMVGTPQIEKSDIFITSVVPDSPASDLGLETGDEIVSINGVEIDTPGILAREIQKGGDLDLRYIQEEGGVKEGVTSPNDEGLIGIRFEARNVEISMKPRRFLEATRAGTFYFLRMVKRIVLLPVIVVQDNSESLSFQGLWSVGKSSQDVIQESVERNTLYPLFLFAFVINAGLGVLNLYPIPALDGGHVMFALVEIIRGGKRVNRKTETIITRAFYYAVIALSIWLTVRDFIVGTQEINLFPG
jgi:regulator of sigma E protease